MIINEIRRQFPVLDQQVYGKPLVYLDNAATTQKPICVIDRERDYYLHENCNIHRGVHYLSQQATEAYEHARQTVADFVHAKDLQRQAAGQKTMRETACLPIMLVLSRNFILVGS